MSPVKWGIALIVVVAVLAAPATAAAPTLNGLQRQIVAIRAQVVALQAAQKTLGGNDQMTRDWATCFHAQDLDAINGVWHTLVLLAQYNGFPAQPDYPRYDDGGACQRVGQTRIR